MTAILALLLTNLPSIVRGGQAVFELISHIRRAGQQTGEWTPENEATFQAELAKAQTAPEWQPDAK